MALSSAVLAFPALSAALEPAAAHRPGDLVSNFGAIARVVAELDPQRGLLLRALPGQGFAPGRDRWFADPAKCSPVR